MQVYSFFEENNTAYIVMEYLKGKTLAQLVEERGALPEKEAVGYIEKAAGALEEVHRAKLLHRDIKPENIMVCEDGRVVLIDFGLTKKVEESVGLGTRQFTNTTRFGSDGYAPPEQYLKSGVLGTHTDIYALGATLYFLLTAQVPPSAIERASGVAMVSPRSMNSKTSRTTNSAVMKAINLRPDVRLQTVNDFLSALKSKAQPAAAPSSTNTSSTLPSVPQHTVPANRPLLLVGQKVVKPYRNIEMIIETPSGALTSHRHTTLGNKKLEGKYMDNVLNRVLINLQLKNGDTGETKCFTGLEVSFHNVWKYRLPIFNSIKIIDSEGFQYDSVYRITDRFDHIVIIDKDIDEANIESPQSELEDGAKTRGWIWFKEILGGAVPRRVVVSRYIFDPGHRSGRINDEEFQEFEIGNFELVDLKII